MNDDMGEISQRVGWNMRQAYWDKLEQEILSKDYDNTLIVLTEISERICMFVPNRIDLHKELDEVIDIDLIKQMLKHDAVDFTIIYKLIHFIITQLKQFDCIEDEPYYEIWREQVERRLKADPPEMHKILPKFFKECFYRIEKVDYNIKLFRESEMYKTIKEQIERRRTYS